MRIVEDLVCLEKIGDIEKELNGKIVFNTTDNTFEGIIETKSNNSFLVFGQINKNYLELTRCSKNKFEFKKRYECVKEKDSYKGDIICFTNRKQYNCGECRIMIKDPLEYRDILDSEDSFLDIQIGGLIKCIDQKDQRIYYEHIKKKKI